MVEAGLSVLMVDAGTPPAPSLDRRPPLAELRTGAEGAWRHLLGEDYSKAQFAPGVSPKLRTVDGFDFERENSRANRIRTEGFRALGALVPGGLSNVWGAVACAFTEADFAAYPIGLKDMKPSYYAVAERIGLNGEREHDMSASVGDFLPLQPPLPLSPLTERLLKRYRKAGGGREFRLGRPHNAVLSLEMGERKACGLDLGCMFGCPVGAIYNSAHDLAALRRQDTFDYRPNVLVESVSRGRVGHTIRAVDMVSGNGFELSAKTVVLAAGTLPTTRLALRVLELYDEEIPLLNTQALSAAFWVPSMLGRPLPRDGYGMAQLCFERVLSDGAGGELFGLLYDANAMAAPDLMAHMPLTRPGAMAVTRALLSSLALVLLYFPGVFSANRARLVRGQSANAPELVVEGGVRKDFGAVARRNLSRVARDFARLGAYRLPGSSSQLSPGAEAHYAGTLPMGKRTTATGEIVGLEGLYAADGSVLNHLPAKQLTLTIMANADRIGRHIAGSLGA